MSFLSEVLEDSIIFFITLIAMAMLVRCGIYDWIINLFCRMAGI